MSEVQVGFKCDQELKDQIDAYCTMNGVAKRDFFRKACIRAMQDEEPSVPKQRLRSSPGCDVGFLG